MEALLKKIHQHAYWRVLLRPGEFDQKRVPSLGRCKEIVTSSQVVLRGCEYPVADEVMIGQDWIESSCDWDGGPHYEYWRLFQSGQFVHHFSCAEEFHALPWTPSPKRYLLVFNTLYTVTEIYEFAGRLAAQGVLRPSADIIVQLWGMQGRELTTQHPFEWPRLRGRISSMEMIEHHVTVAAASLVGSATELGLDAATAIFEHFGWLNPPRDSLEEQQKKLLERRLGV